MRTWILIGGAIALLWPVSGAWAQDEAETKSKREEILAMLDLPRSAQALRKKGVDKSEVKAALREAKRKKVKAKHTKELLDSSAEAVESNGPIDNFGAFVKSKLEAGLRGRELAAAIHAEHKARGKGKGKGKDKAKGKEKGPKDVGKGKTPSEDEAEDAGKGKTPSEDEAEEAGEKGGKGRGKGKKGKP